MAQYKVPQDVEADDKLIGPFSFRQFVYLLIAGGLIALSVGLFQIFPFLVIVPLPFILLFLALALPIKKDQPMETYLAALISYYTKPRRRVWTPGQRESSISITAPKIVEETRARDLTQEEATHRLSFLADIVDSGGYSIKGSNNNPMRDDLYAEANSVTDMFDKYETTNLDRAISEDKKDRHAEAIKEMKNAIDRNENLKNAEIKGRVVLDNKPDYVAPEPVNEEVRTENVPKRDIISEWASKPESQKIPEPDFNAPFVVLPEKPQPKKNVPTKPTKPSIMELANNSDFSVATIAKEANRINRKDEGEVFISLH